MARRATLRARTAVSDEIGARCDDAEAHRLFRAKQSCRAHLPRRQLPPPNMQGGGSSTQTIGFATFGGLYWSYASLRSPYTEDGDV
eukprot:scaffold129553_cov36-Tisochrysis_lutea.AAC.7